MYISRLKTQHKKKHNQQVQGNYYYSLLFGNGEVTPGILRQVQEGWEETEEELFSTGTICLGGRLKISILGGVQGLVRLTPGLLDLVMS